MGGGKKKKKKKSRRVPGADPTGSFARNTNGEPEFNAPNIFTGNFSQYKDKKFKSQVPSLDFNTK